MSIPDGQDVFLLLHLFSKVQFTPAGFRHCCFILCRVDWSPGFWQSLDPVKGQLGPPLSDSVCHYIQNKAFNVQLTGGLLIITIITSKCLCLFVISQNSRQCPYTLLVYVSYTDEATHFLTSHQGLTISRKKCFAAAWVTESVAAGMFSDVLYVWDTQDGHFVALKPTQVFFQHV